MCIGYRMPFDAKIYRVMIASPSDVAEARGIVRRAIESWNAANSIDRGMVLFPVAWETAAAPALGDRAQAIINDQLGICDVLVGVFWTKLGTPTGTSASGTVEEIERHVKAGSLVMLYFSNQPAAPDTVDADQFKALKTAKSRYMSQGLVDSYESLAELEQKIVHGLTIHMNKRATALGPSAASDPIRHPTPNLSDSARHLLREAVKDRNGTVMKLATLGGGILQTNGQNLVTSKDPRERAKWEGALQELVNEGFLEAVGYKGEVFKVTAEGYRVGDTL
jgi:hypothetical protein